MINSCKRDKCYTPLLNDFFADCNLRVWAIAMLYSSGTVYFLHLGYRSSSSFKISYSQTEWFNDHMAGRVQHILQNTTATGVCQSLATLFGETYLALPPTLSPNMDRDQPFHCKSCLKDRLLSKFSDDLLFSSLQGVPPALSSTFYLYGQCSRLLFQWGF